MCSCGSSPAKHSVVYFVAAGTIDAHRPAGTKRRLRAAKEATRKHDDETGNAAVVTVALYCYYYYLYTFFFF